MSNPILQKQTTTSLGPTPYKSLSLLKILKSKQKQLTDGGDTENNDEVPNPEDCKVLPMTWAATDMQGWRKTMEDAHITHTFVTPPKIDGAVEQPSKVFAVFDGHGGSEVAHFCAKYFLMF